MLKPLVLIQKELKQSFRTSNKLFISGHNPFKLKFRQEAELGCIPYAGVQEDGQLVTDQLVRINKKSGGRSFVIYYKRYQVCS